MALLCVGFFVILDSERKTKTVHAKGEFVLKKRHKFYYAILRPLVIAFLKIRFGYTYEVAGDLPDNYIVLSNHATDYDMLFVGASFKRQMYFVGSEHIARWKTLYKLIRYAFDPIMRSKGSLAAGTALDVVRKAKRGGNVCLFAEGVRTWDGVTCPILPSTGKLIKSAGCGLVTYKIVGGYFASPMWGGAGVRRGKVHGAPVRVFTKEQVGQMSATEIYEVIVADLYEDAYARQLKEPCRYRGKNLAQRMENLLFVCPECQGRDTFCSQGDEVTCGACGLSFRYDAYGTLGGAPFGTVKEFSDWQKQEVVADVRTGAVYTAADATLSVVQNHREERITNGPASISPQALTCGETVFSLTDISDLAMHGQRALVFTARGSYYELIPSQEANALKFLLYFHAYKMLSKTEMEVV